MKQRVTLALLALLVALPLAAQSRFTFTPATPPLATAPMRGTFYSMQRQSTPPVPFNRFPALPVYEVAPGVYLVDDRSVDYAALAWLQSALSGDPEPLDDDPPPAYGPYPGQLGLEIFEGQTLVTNLLRNTEAGKTYALLSATNLNDPVWVLVEQRQATNDATYFTPLPKFDPWQCYFRAAHVPPVVAVSQGWDATEPGPSGGRPAGQGGSFTILCAPAPAYALTVAYTLSGTAVNGLDYTNLAGTVTFPGDGVANSVDVDLDPKPDFLLEGDETVTLTVVSTDDYAVNVAATSATVAIHDNVFDVVAELPDKEPIGIGYHPPTQSLIVSVYLDPWNVGWSEPTNAFLQIYTNATSPVALVTNWSDITGLADEVKLTIAQSTGNGFTNGQMFFGNGRSGWLGRLSADGASAETNWLHLPTTEHLRGSVCLDETGVWNGDLIAVTGDSQDLLTGTRDVWRISANGVSNLVAQIATPHLEGVTTLPNDPAWGPWAGKIITGDEFTRMVFVVGTNTAVANYDTTELISGGIRPEDFDVVRPSQDLYCAQGSGRLLRVPAQLIAASGGQLVITQAGEVGQPGALFFLAWDSDRFTVARIAPPDTVAGSFEHSSFAPIQLPATPL